MHLNPYGEYAVVLAESLANSWPSTREELIQRTKDVGMTKTFPVMVGDLERTRAVIDEWLSVVDAADEPTRAATLNRIIADTAAVPHLTDHDNEGWHLHYREYDRDLPDTLRAVISMGTALHLTTRGMHRLHRCAAGEDAGDDCRNVVVDISRNGTQKYCSVRCANRAAVRRHRANHRGAG